MVFDKAFALASLLGLVTLSACSSNDTTGSGASDGSGGHGNASSSNTTDGGGGASSQGTGGSTAAGGGGQAGSGGAIPGGITKVGTGEYETFFLKDGVIYGYGASAGTLGQGSYQGLVIPPRPVVLPAGLKFVDVQGGLHQSMGIDENGFVWTWGEADQGLQGSGSATPGDGSTPYKITVDATGAAFDHIVGIEPSVANANGEVQYDLAIKDDGTVWGWGDLVNGLTGDGTAGGIVQKPTRIPIPLPSGVKIIKVLGSSGAYALADDGSVWTWGTGDGNMLGTGEVGTTVGYAPKKVQGLPSGVVDIAVGYSGFDYALTKEGALWGWGFRNAYLGISNAPVYAPQNGAIDLTDKLNLPAKVKAVVCDFMTTHVILEDGTLWGWGDNATGLVGSGHELDWPTTNTPYAWDFGAFELPQYVPIQIAPEVHNFARLFAHSPFLFYDYAQTTDGDLYSWGRNKTGCLGNGVYPLSANGNSGTSSEMAGTYPNSWDVTSPQKVTPFTTPPKGVNSRYCVTNPNGADCI